MRLYLILAGALAFMALAALAFWYRGEAAAAQSQRDMARAALSIAEAANKAQTKAIEDLRQQAKRDDAINAELTQRLQELAVENAANADELAKLKEQNADVRSYLVSPVPDALRRLYDRGTASSDPH